MKELPQLTAKQITACTSLLRRRCCNYLQGGCILLDCPCPQEHWPELLCQWFRSAVLPNDPQLEAEILKHPENTKRCAVCGKPFHAGSNRAVYCDDCRKTVRRQTYRQAQRKRRARQ